MTCKLYTYEIPKGLSLYFIKEDQLPQRSTLRHPFGSFGTWKLGSMVRNKRYNPNNWDTLGKPDTHHLLISKQSMGHNLLGCGNHIFTGNGKP